MRVKKKISLILEVRNDIWYNAEEESLELVFFFNRLFNRNKFGNFASTGIGNKNFKKCLHLYKYANLSLLINRDAINYDILSLLSSVKGERCFARVECSRICRILNVVLCIGKYVYKCNSK